MSKSTLSTHLYFADFETTSQVDYEAEGKVRVYQWGLMDETGVGYDYGTDIDEFLQKLNRMTGSNLVYFFNAKFDTSFIMSRLIDQGYISVKKTSKNQPKKEMSVLGDGQTFYSLTFLTSFGGTVEIYDAYKMFPGTSIDKIGKSIGLHKEKELIDYNRRHYPGEEASADELEYMKRDIEIMRRAMMAHFETSQGKIDITRASFAYADNVVFYGRDRFRKNFPKFPMYDQENIREAYYGGYVYVNPLYVGQIVGEGIVLDINSLFPSVMATKDLPYGAPQKFNGAYENQPETFKKKFPLYIVEVKNVKFTLKKGHIPTLPKQLGVHGMINSSKDLKDMYKKSFTVAEPDLRHFINNYDIEGEIEYGNGYAFRKENAPFKAFVDYWINEKILAKTGGMSEEEYKKWHEETGQTVYDPFHYMVAKLTLNSAYGKFAQNPYQDSYKVYKDENGIMKYEEIPFDPNSNKKTPFKYIPMAVYITAQARDVLFTAAEKVADRVLYIDTDSMHLKGKEIPDIDLDDARLGAWKIEDDFFAAKYLRDKTYMEIEYASEDEIKAGKFIMYRGIKAKFVIKAAGLSPESKATIKSPEEFNLGQVYPFNKTQRKVPGGTLIISIDKAISPARIF